MRSKPFEHPSSYNRRSGFTLPELLIVVAIVVILAVSVTAPYSYYSDVAKLRISAEKIEQLFTEAAVSASAGGLFPGTEKNADTYVVLLEGSSSVALSAAVSGSGFAPDSDRKTLRDVPLEKDVVLSGIPEGGIVVKCQAPEGGCRVFSSDGTLNAAFTGAVVRFKNGSSASLSKPFVFRAR